MKIKIRLCLKQVLKSSLLCTAKKKQDTRSLYILRHDVLTTILLEKWSCILTFLMGMRERWDKVNLNILSGMPTDHYDVAWAGSVKEDYPGFIVLLHQRNSIHSGVNPI